MISWIFKPCVYVINLRLQQRTQTLALMIHGIMPNFTATALSWEDLCFLYETKQTKTIDNKENL